jgi:hypothetical protein
MRRLHYVLLLLAIAIPSPAEDNALIRIGDTWRYLKTASGDSPPRANWHTRDFNEAQWRNAPSGYRLPEDEPGHERPANPAPFHMYLRKAFQVENARSIHALVLQVEHEAGFTAYLNGVEIARYRGKGVRFPTPAERAAGMEDPEVFPEILDISDFIPVLETGENLLAIEGPGSGESLSTFTIAAAVVVNFLRGPFVQNTTTDGTQIFWRSGVSNPGTTFVEYGTTDALGLLYTNSNPLIDHLVTLTGLMPDTTYYYRVGTLITRNSATIVSAIESFRTFKTSGPIRFVVFGDSGQGTVNQGRIASVIRDARPDLVLHCGDIVYGGFNDSTADTRYFNYYRDHIKSTPYFLTVGNHDIGCCGGGEVPDMNATNWFLNATNFQNAYYLPTNSLTGTEHFYSFDHGDAHFVSLYNPWFSNYRFLTGTDQLAWLTNDLAATSKPWKFLFFHMPVANSGLHAQNDLDANQVRDQAELLNFFAPFAREYGVQMIFAGHDHNFERFAPTNGLHHCVNGGGGGGVYQLSTRHPASAQFHAVNNCTKVSLRDDTLTLEVLDANGSLLDSMVIHRGTTPERIYQSTWNTPEIETQPANDGDGNRSGQTFDLVGRPMLTRAGETSNLGWVHVNNDSTNLYLGIKSPMFYASQNIHLFIESPRLTGVHNLTGLGNNVVDPADQGVDGLDFLEHLSFTNFTPAIACILGDEFADGQYRSFNRPNATFNTGQGIFRLDAGFTDVPGARLQQFNRSPQSGPVANDANADLIEISIPFSELGNLQPGDIIKVGAVVGNVRVDPDAPRYGLDASVLGVLLSTNAAGESILAGVRVRMAFMPELDTDGDGLLDNWETEFGLDFTSAEDDDGANGDPDRDGATNVQEQMMGTDPLNPASRP